MAAADEPAGEQLQAQALVYHQAFGVIKSMALKCALDLGIADIIHRRGRPLALSELEGELHLGGVMKGDALRRLMRLLVHMGCFSSGRGGGGGGGEDAYGLTAFSRLLVKGNPNSPWWFLDTALGPLSLSMWSLLGAWFKADQPTPFHMASAGRSMWEVTAEDPAFNDAVNESMAGDSRLLVDVVVRECGDTFRGLRSLVDVGGGTGSVARAIAAAFPGLECTVFDLPHVVAAAAPEAAGVGFVGGDMFDRVPKADAVLLKSILHDWGDDDCVRILKRCREAIPPSEGGGKVILIDIVVNSREDDDPVVTEVQYFFDMAMMAANGGKERDEREWQKIFVDAGFADYKVKHKLGFRSLVEVYP